MAARLFLLLLAVFLLVTSREPPWADAHVVYDTTAALVSRGELHVHLPGPPQFFAVRNGRKYGVFPLGNVIAQVPSYLAFRLLRPIRALPVEPLFALTSHLSPALLMAASCLLLRRLCLRRGASPGWAVALALGCGLSTLCFGYARVAYSEALQTAALLLLVERTLVAGDRMGAGVMAGLGLAAGALFSAKLVYALLLPLPVLYLAHQHLRARRTPLPSLLSGCAVALLVFLPFFALALWHNWLKTGSVLDTGYRIPVGVFSGDLLPGLYGFTLSTGKSMFLYSPPLVLGLLGLRTGLARRRAETVFLLSVIAAVMLFNAKFRHWHADYCWGPRHLVPVTPLCLLLALPWLPEAAARRPRRRTWLYGLMGLGLAVQLLGAAFYWDHYIRILIAIKDQTGAQGWFQEQLGHGHYIPQFSPLRGHLWLLSHKLRRDPDLDHDAPWKLIVPERVDLRAHWEALRFDWWALDWLTGPTRAPAAGAALLLLFGGGALAAGLSLRRRLRREGAGDETSTGAA
jgi:hypothetical protein